ncbi:hypothetical protein DRP53_09835 [candidate division WOR-3 bacterium]|uniref:Polymerase nucleotidyl transferase domain-containing protein n=1 Tax=candidate division WOR-3 bacterium TaxID=2052148 RepID=A0A660SFU0_UNCW3|nr:MAG: hypothetical protein DRP53_09835 [candidate division WOR-3 bacterium]
MRRRKDCTFEAVKEAILRMGGILREAEAVGVMGSLARGDFSDRSDIDIFVIVKEKKSGYDVDRIWWDRINEALSLFHRDVTVVVYSVNGLRRISNWYVLRLASEGILVYDKGGIKGLFRKIIETARRAGLVERMVGNHRVWSAINLDLGERLKLEVKD